MSITALVVDVSTLLLRCHDSRCCQLSQVTRDHRACLYAYMSRRHQALIRLFVPLAILCTLWTILAGRSGMFIPHDERLAVQPEMRNVYASTVRAAVRRRLQTQPATYLFLRPMLRTDRPNGLVSDDQPGARALAGTRERVLRTDHVIRVTDIFTAWPSSL